MIVRAIVVWSGISGIRREFKKGGVKISVILRIVFC